MSRPEEFEGDWVRFRDLIASGQIQSVKSEFWDRLIREFDAPRAAGRPGLFGADRNRSYNFLDASSQGISEKAAKFLLQATYLASGALKRASEWFWNFNLNNAARGHLTGFPRYRKFLDRLGILGEYRALCAELGMAEDNMASAKAFYAFSLTREAVGAPESVLEIGGGAGVLACILLRKSTVRRYALVDLPEMLLLSSLTIRELFPELPLVFSFRQPEGVLALPERGVLLVTPQDAGRLPPSSFDLCVNLNSFQEMTAEQVDGYLGLIHAASRPGAGALTINRRKMVGTFDNNPLLYPYRPSRVLRWEADPFFDAVFKDGRKDPHFLRIERILK